MSFQPPPPPPGGNPPPPPGQWGPPPGGSPAQFDPKSVNPLDWGIVGAGVLAFIFSFVSYYTFETPGTRVGGQTFGGVSVSESAWSGFFGWFAMLAALVGSAAVAMQLFAPQVKLPFPNRLVGLAAYGVALLCVILALFVIPDYLGISVPDSVDTGHGFGYWVSLIVIIAGLALSLMRFQATGGELPGGMNSKMPNIGGYGPQDPGGRPGPGGHPGPGGPPGPPPGNYGPPQ